MTRSMWQQMRSGWRILAAAGLVYCAAMAVIVTVRAADVPMDEPDYDVVRAESTLDFRDYWFTARHLRETGALTTDFGVHNYLPFFTIFMLPWSYLPLVVAAPAFVVLILLLFFGATFLVEAMLNQTVSPQPRAVYVAALLLLLAYVTSAAVLGAVDLLVVALVLGTWILFEQRQEWTAGVLLGLAALIKIIPGLLVVFFLLQRRWRLAGATAITLFVGGVLLPWSVLGWEQTRAEYERFFDEAAMGHSARATLTEEKPQKAKYSNNALPIVLRRVLTETDADPREDQPGMFVNVVDLPRPVVFWVYVMLVTVVAATSVQVTLARPRAWPPTEPQEVSVLRGQFGVWCCLLLFLTPLLWTRYLLYAAWPLLFVAHRTERAQHRWIIEHRTGLAVLLAWLLGAVLLASPAARAVGAQLWSVLALWIGLLIIIAWQRLRGQDADERPGYTADRDDQPNPGRNPS